MFRFGIIGAGSIAEKFCQAVKRTEDGVVAAVASKNGRRAEEFAERNGIENFYGGYEEMLRKEKPDAVYVATTNDFHFENIMLCLKQGIPVLCEKPVFMHEKEAQEAFALARKNKVFVMEGMWSLNKELGGGSLYDLMVYPVEILMYLVNQPLRQIHTKLIYGTGDVDVTDSVLLQFETCQASCQVTSHSRIPSPCGLYCPCGIYRLSSPL